METINKKIELQKALKTEDVEAITTDNFNGLWFSIDGFDAIVLSNEELSYASNNIVDGDIMEVMPEHELFDKVNIFYPY